MSATPFSLLRGYSSAARRPSRRAMSASAIVSRCLVFSTTSAGAFPVNEALPSLADICWASLRAVARSFSSRFRSASTSTVPARSSSTVTPSAASAAETANPSAGGTSHSSERIASSCAASGVDSIPASLAGTRCPGRSPWSDRNRRISVTSRISEASSASAAWSVKEYAGQAAVITESSPVSAHHSSSVTNGMTGCSSRSIWSSTNPSTRLVVSAARVSPEVSGTLASSRYQSQNSSQAKWYSASQALPNSYRSSSPSTSAITLDSRDRIHRSDKLRSLISNGLVASAPFSNANLVAFQSLLHKFLEPATQSSLTAVSLPGLDPRASVNLTASAPNRSIQSSGSAVFPRDLDIFLP